MQVRYELHHQNSGKTTIPAFAIVSTKISHSMLFFLKFHATLWSTKWMQIIFSLVRRFKAKENENLNLIMSQIYP